MTWVPSRGSDPIPFAMRVCSNGSSRASRVRNGSTWISVGAGMNGAVQALQVFDDGSGTALYAAGAFTTADGAPANHIAKWDGASWSPLGFGPSTTTESLVAYDDGSGPALYARGQFTSAGGVVASHVARYATGLMAPAGSTVYVVGGTSAPDEGRAWGYLAKQVAEGRRRAKPVPRVPWR